MNTPVVGLAGKLSLQSVFYHLLWQLKQWILLPNTDNRRPIQDSFSGFKFN